MTGWRDIARLRKLSVTALLALVMVVTSGCWRRDLEVYDAGTARLHIYTDWESSYGATPSEMTLLIYGSDNKLQQVIENQEDPTHTTVDLKAGEYRLIIFNGNSDIDAFPSLRFENLSDYDKAAVRAKMITTRALKNWDQGTQYMCDPLEPFGCAVDTIVITPDMLEKNYVFVDYRDRDKLPKSITDFNFYEVVDPMRTKIEVRVYIKKGFKYLRSMEGNISGMADGFYLNRVDRTQETGTLLFDSWQIESIPGEIDKGWVKTTLDTWGLPFGKEMAVNREATDNMLNLAFLLNGKDTRGNNTFTYSYPVGKIMRYLTPTGDALSKAEVLKHIEVEITIDGDWAPELPDVEPEEPNGAGFDAHVADWEDGGTISLGGF